MKNILFAILFAICGSTAFAQIEKGRWIVGGNANFESSKYENADDSTRKSVFQANPNIGFFFINKLAVGLRGNFERRKIKGINEGFNSYAGGPFLRYYLFPAPMRLNIFADAGFAFGKRNVEEGISGNITKREEGFNQLNFSAGSALFLNKHAAFEFGLKYTSTGGDFYGGKYRLNAVGFNAGFQVHLGGGSGQ